MPLTAIKKLIWYPASTKPPERTEKNGNLPIILLTGERIQEGLYSHQEDKFYVKAQRYRPKTMAEEIVQSVSEINDALEWEEVEKKPDKWMLITIPN